MIELHPFDLLESLTKKTVSWRLWIQTSLFSPATAIKDHPNQYLAIVNDFSPRIVKKLNLQIVCTLDKIEKLDKVPTEEKRMQELQLHRFIDFQQIKIKRSCSTSSVHSMTDSFLRI